MEKTKWGITAALMAAIMYFSGLASSLIVFLLAGYILIAETSAWLRSNAVKAMLVVAVFGILGATLGVVGYFFDILGGIFNSMVQFHISTPAFINGIIVPIFRILERLSFFILGIMALGGKSFAFPGVDGLIRKHMGGEGAGAAQATVYHAVPQPAPQQPQQQVYTGAAPQPYMDMGGVPAPGVAPAPFSAAPPAPVQQYAAPAPPAAPAQQAGGVCAMCGGPLSAEATFCGNCGAPTGRQQSLF